MSSHSLNARLAAADLTPSLEKARELWTYQDIEVTLAGMAAFGSRTPSRPMEWLLSKVRGSLGAILLRSASPGRLGRTGCNWPATCASELFFGDRPDGTTTPFMLWADVVGGDLMIRARVFGFACEWASALSHALVEALRFSMPWEVMARDLDSQTQREKPWRRMLVLPTSMVRQFAGTAAIPKPAPSSVGVHFLTHTPIRAEREGRAVDGTGEPLPTDAFVWFSDALPRRLRGLAPWMGINPEFVSEAAAHAIEQVRAVEKAAMVQTGPAGHHWHENRPDLGFLPQPITLTQPAPDMLAALQMAETCGVGRATVLGCGQFTIKPRG